MATETVKIAGSQIGGGEPCYIVAEIGINHNGDLDLARQLIAAAKLANCNAVKFQKRTLNVVYSAEELARPRENPFGPTNGDLKHGLEFTTEDYQALDDYCNLHNIAWFASCWDEASVDFIADFDPPAFKIGSASLTDDNLLRHHLQYKKPIILSTGMSTVAEIDHAVEVLGTKNLVIMHSTSTYPSKHEELNLRMIPTLKDRYQVPIGYSGHEVGLATTVAAVALGACMVERHITLNRASWGSDQAASVEPQGFSGLTRNIRAVETALGDGVKQVYDSEVPIKAKLRRIG